jgi:hypothetical protein
MPESPAAGMMSVRFDAAKLVRVERCAKPNF